MNQRHSFFVFRRQRVLHITQSLFCRPQQKSQWRAKLMADIAEESCFASI